MACNKDSSCLNIARSIYPNLQSEINSSIDEGKKIVNDARDELDKIEPPDDYLGNKIKGQLADIWLLLGEDLTYVTTLGSNINSFIDRNIKEHERHYHDWQRMQRELKEKNEEEENNKIKV